MVTEAGLDLRLNCWLSFIGSAARFAVPDKIFGLTLTLDFIDRCTALPSLTPPPAAVGSLTQRATLGGLITRRPIEAFFMASCTEKDIKVEINQQIGIIEYKI